MSANRNYKDSEIVWVKLGNNWWPAEVVGPHRQPEDLTSHLKRIPSCVVKFFNEDTFEYVKSAHHVYPFQCSRKEEFIKKGMALFEAKKKFMDKFPADVKFAERLTSTSNGVGDTLIINDRPNSIVKAILGQSLILDSDSVHSVTKSQKNRDTVTKFIDITSKGKHKLPKTSKEKLLIPNNKSCIVHPSQNSVLFESIGNSDKSTQYRCNMCGFTSQRQNVIIFHRKSHCIEKQNSSFPQLFTKSTKLTEDTNTNLENFLIYNKNNSLQNSKNISTCTRIVSPVVSSTICFVDPLKNIMENKLLKKKSSKVIKYKKMDNSTKPKLRSSKEDLAVPNKIHHDFSSNIYKDGIPCSTQGVSSDKSKEIRRTTMSPKLNLEKIRQKLLADWSDEEKDDQKADKNCVISTVNLVSLMSNNTQQSNPEISKSSFVGTKYNDLLTFKEIDNGNPGLLKNCIRNIPKKDHRRSTALKQFNIEYSDQSTSKYEMFKIDDEKTNDSMTSLAIIAKPNPTFTGESSIQCDNFLTVKKKNITKDLRYEKHVQNTLQNKLQSKDVVDLCKGTDNRNTLSCFDFQEEEEEEHGNDILRSISKFKKKYLSSEKVCDDSIDLEFITHNKTVVLNKQTTSENNFSLVGHENLIEPDQQLCNEIATLLQETDTVLEKKKKKNNDHKITKIINKNESLVKSLSIKDQSKRIFKSRNQSIADDFRKFANGNIESENNILKIKKKSVDKKCKSSNFDLTDKICENFNFKELICEKNKSIGKIKAHQTASESNLAKNKTSAHISNINNENKLIILKEISTHMPSIQDVNVYSKKQNKIIKEKHTPEIETTMLVFKNKSSINFERKKITKKMPVKSNKLCSNKKSKNCTVKGLSHIAPLTHNSKPKKISDTDALGNVFPSFVDYKHVVSTVSPNLTNELKQSTMNKTLTTPYSKKEIETDKYAVIVNKKYQSDNIPKTKKRYLDADKILNGNDMFYKNDSMVNPSHNFCLSGNDIKKEKPQINITKSKRLRPLNSRTKFFHIKQKQENRKYTSNHNSKIKGKCDFNNLRKNLVSMNSIKSMRLKFKKDENELKQSVCILKANLKYRTEIPENVKHNDDQCGMEFKFDDGIEIKNSNVINYNSFHETKDQSTLSPEEQFNMDGANNDNLLKNVVSSNSLNLVESYINKGEWNTCLSKNNISPNCTKKNIAECNSIPIVSFNSNQQCSQKVNDIEQDNEIEQKMLNQSKLSTNNKLINSEFNCLHIRKKRSKLLLNPMLESSEVLKQSFQRKNECSSLLSIDHKKKNASKSKSELSYLSKSKLCQDNIYTPFTTELLSRPNVKCSTQEEQSVLKMTSIKKLPKMEKGTEEVPSYILDDSLQMVPQNEKQSFTHMQSSNTDTKGIVEAVSKIKESTNSMPVLLDNYEFLSINKEEILCSSSNSLSDTKIEICKHHTKSNDIISGTSLTEIKNGKLDIVQLLHTDGCDDLTEDCIPLENTERSRQMQNPVAYKKTYQRQNEKLANQKQQIDVDVVCNKFVIVETPASDGKPQNTYHSKLSQRHQAEQTNLSSIEDSSNATLFPLLDPDINENTLNFQLKAKTLFLEGTGTTRKKQAGNTITLASNKKNQELKKKAVTTESISGSNTNDIETSDTMLHKNECKSQQFLYKINESKRISQFSSSEIFKVMSAEEDVSYPDKHHFALKSQTKPLHHLLNLKQKSQSKLRVPQSLHKQSLMDNMSILTCNENTVPEHGQPFHNDPLSMLSEKQQLNQHMASTSQTSLPETTQSHIKVCQNQRSASIQFSDFADNYSELSQEMQPLDGTSKILAVPTQPILGYNETFLLCTMVNNNYKPIDNIPLYLDQDLNQLVPIPLETSNRISDIDVHNSMPSEHPQGLFTQSLKSFDVNASISNQLIRLESEINTDENGKCDSRKPEAQITQESLITDGSSVGSVEEMIYVQSDINSEINTDNAIILNVEGQQIVLDSATFSQLLDSTNSQTQLITDDGTAFILPREVLAAIEAQTQHSKEVEPQLSNTINIQPCDVSIELSQSNMHDPTLGDTNLYCSALLQVETSQEIDLIASDASKILQTSIVSAVNISPPIPAHTSETNSVLDQTPIMSTLENPSTAVNIKQLKLKANEIIALEGLRPESFSSNLNNNLTNLEKSLADIGVTPQSSIVPSCLELPITVTNPAIASNISLTTPTEPVQFQSRHLPTNINNNTKDVIENN